MARYRLPPEGQSSPQAACKVPAVVMADYARGISLEDCELEHTGTYGVWFRDGCRDCSVQRCLLQDLGAGGVRLGQTDRDPKPVERTSHIRIDNNIIRSAGHVWPDAVGVLIGHSGNNQITHNDISGLAYTGISVGWRWGYGEVPSVQNSIRFNHIHHLGWDVLADMGGIYTLGEAPGTVLGNNVIHDIDGDGDSGMHGLYNDNSTSQMLLENNLVYEVRDGGYQIGSGKGNILRNNVFVARSQGVSTHGQLLFCMYYPVEQHVAATFEKNIIYGSGGKLFSVPATFGERLQFRNNLYWEPSARRWTSPAKRSTPGRSSGATQARSSPTPSSSPRPSMTSVCNRIRRPLRWALSLSTPLRPGSTAIRPGSPRREPSGIRRANTRRRVHRSRSRMISRRRRSAIRRRWPAFTREKAGAIAVTEELAASGRRCLKITDAPGLKFAHDPHFYYTPRQNRGRATLAFDIRIEQGAQLYCEWREYPGVPYFHTGPRIAIRDAKLTAGGNPPLPVPLGKWFHVEMSAGQGDQADGTWQLTVALPGETPKQFHTEDSQPAVSSHDLAGFRQRRDAGRRLLSRQHPAEQPCRVIRGACHTVPVTAC